MLAHLSNDVNLLSACHCESLCKSANAVVSGAVRDVASGAASEVLGKVAVEAESEAAAEAALSRSSPVAGLSAGTSTSTLFSRSAACLLGCEASRVSLGMAQLCRRLWHELLSGCLLQPAQLDATPEEDTEAGTTPEEGMVAADAAVAGEQLGGDESKMSLFGGSRYTNRRRSVRGSFYGSVLGSFCGSALESFVSI